MTTNANANAMNDTATDDVLLAGLLEQLGDDDALLEMVEADSTVIGDDSGIIEPMLTDAADTDTAPVVDDVDSLLDDVAAAAAKHDVYSEQTDNAGPAGTAGTAPQTDAAALTESAKKKGGRKGNGKQSGSGGADRNDR